MLDILGELRIWLKQTSNSLNPPGKPSRRFLVVRTSRISSSSMKVERIPTSILTGYLVALSPYGIG